MKTHTFEPDRYFNTIGSHNPVLHIQPGDRVVTKTIDAHGQDENGENVITGPNPQTGPFFVEGSLPGDMLVIRFEQIMPNRALGWSYQQLAANVLDPQYLQNAAGKQSSIKSAEKAVWEIDQSNGTAILKDSQTMLDRLPLPMAPFLGCFGVAPEHQQAISTATSGPYGGNMDYRGFIAGTTAYLPVFESGALFFLGDGHAVQGDGEIGGTGVEISMTVIFQVELVKEKTIAWPRGEDQEYIFTIGNARPLDQALQHATTEMVRWLHSDWNLDSASAALLMTQTVRYEIGNVFDPAYTVVCKLSKRWLENLPV